MDNIAVLELEKVIAELPSYEWRVITMFIFFPQRYESYFVIIIPLFHVIADVHVFLMFPVRQDICLLGTFVFQTHTMLPWRLESWSMLIGASLSCVPVIGGGREGRVERKGHDEAEEGEVQVPEGGTEPDHPHTGWAEETQWELPFSARAVILKPLWNWPASFALPLNPKAFRFT